MKNLWIAVTIIAALAACAVAARLTSTNVANARRAEVWHITVYTTHWSADGALLTDGIAWEADAVGQPDVAGSTIGWTGLDGQRHSERVPEPPTLDIAPTDETLDAVAR